MDKLGNVYKLEDEESTISREEELKRERDRARIEGYIMAKDEDGKLDEISELLGEINGQTQLNLGDN